MRKIKHWLVLFMSIPILLASTAAHADVYCSFTINTLFMTPDGWINSSLGGNGYSKGWWICPVSGSTTINDGYQSRTVTSDSCKALWSQFLSLKAAEKPIVLQFHGPADCSSASLPADGTQPSLFPANFGFQN